MTHEEELEPLTVTIEVDTSRFFEAMAQAQQAVARHDRWYQRLRQRLVHALFGAAPPSQN